jgi:NAD(P)-dependent dehydrogenase (short-subunit alcohol dehydrogenase family)
MFKFDGKVAIIVGATRGIGLAATRMLARQGATVVLSSRKAEACAAVEEQLLGCGFKALGVPAHAAREEDIARLVAITIERFGRLDVVIANAGISPSSDLLTETPEESWARILDTNVAGPLRLARHALPHIAAVGGGAMVMTSSVNASVATTGSGAYGISKAGIEQMVRQLAVEWGPRNIRVNAVAPGTIQTDMIRKLMEKPGFVEWLHRTTPLQRLGEPEDVAATMVFLASAEARHITGQTITIDGGQLIKRGD